MSGDESGDSPAGSPGGVDLDSSKESLTSYSNERRRSERVKREKPDYYDALDFEHKRTKSPGRGRRAEKGVYTAPGRSPKVEGRGRGRGHGSNSPSSSSGRAHLTWKKGTEDDEDDRERRRRKRPRHRENENEDFMMEDLTAEKILQCRVGLAEINRKLGVVMVQPS